MKNIIVLNFSPRANGNCADVCRLIREYYANTNIRLFNISEHIAPCNHCNYECLTPDLICPQLTDGYTDMMDAICSSDLAYYVIPKFCGMPNAVYYASNERSVGYFNMDQIVMAQYMGVRKRFIVVSNTENDTFVEALRQQINTDPEILYLKTNRYLKKSIDGDMLQSEAAQNDLLEFLRVDG